MAALSGAKADFSLNNAAMIINPSIYHEIYHLDICPRLKSTRFPEFADEFYLIEKIISLM